MPAPTTLVEKIEKFVDCTPGHGPWGDCHVWTGATHEHGYGVLNHRGRMLKAHRVVFLLTHGYEPTLNLLHRCDNPPCCNLNHLYEGTQRQNGRDARERDRVLKTLAPGERERLIARRKAGATYDELVAEFEISTASIYWHLAQAGLTSPKAKLTAAQRTEIVRRVRSGEARRDLAAEFGVTPFYVGKLDRLAAASENATAVR